MLRDLEVNSLPVFHELLNVKEKSGVYPSMRAFASNDHCSVGSFGEGRSVGIPVESVRPMAIRSLS